MKLTCFVLHVDSNSALHSKRFETLLTMTKARGDSLTHYVRFIGQNLAGIAVKDKSPVQIDYWKVGFYKLVAWGESRQSWGKVEYIDGTKAAVPVTFTIGHSWKLTDNQHPIRATLSKGYSTIPLHGLFAKSNCFVALWRGALLPSSVHQAPPIEMAWVFGICPQPGVAAHARTLTQVSFITRPTPSQWGELSRGFPCDCDSLPPPPPLAPFAWRCAWGSIHLVLSRMLAVQCPQELREGVGALSAPKVASPRGLPKRQSRPTGTFPCPSHALHRSWPQADL